MSWKRSTAPWMIAALLIGACQSTSNQCDHNPELVCEQGYECNEAGTACISSRTCGSRIIELDKNEVCDDGNADACGLCSEDCKQIQRLSVATGIIQVVPGNAVTDGEIFMLDDGTMKRVFEFDTGNSIDGGHIQVAIDSSASANTVASRIADVIRDAGLSITASSSGAEVLLMNLRPGSAGNRAIWHDPPDSGFVFSDMDGGAGRDCSDNTGCTSNDDCASRSCDAGLCQPDAG